MAATTNPLHGTHADAPIPSISTKTYTIAGILVTVHGLSELPANPPSLACLWLLHPRLQTAARMAPLAAEILTAQNARIAAHRAASGSPPPTPLIAASFDQRNHGSRLVDPLHNEAWRQGNPRHAQDMFSCLHGSATDASQLLDHLESYVCEALGARRISRHLVLGISLGGHAAWHCLLGDPRIEAAVVGIGCPDYTRLMADRARLSRRESFVGSEPPGARFLGSPDFPERLREAVALYDPAGLMLPGVFDPVGRDEEVGEAALGRFRALVGERLRGKRILNLSGREDKLVPYAAGEPFLRVLKRVIAEDPGLDVELEDVLFDGVGHAFPHSMVDKSIDWICGLLAGGKAPVNSKI